MKTKYSCLASKWNEKKHFAETKKTQNISPKQLQSYIFTLHVVTVP